MKKALLVIDMQNVCVGEQHAAYFKYDNNKLIEEVNKVIDNNINDLVIYIKNMMQNNLLNKFAPFQAYEGSEEVELVENLHIVSEDVFVKYKGDAFSNPELDAFLKLHEVKCVEVVGVDGGACVALTAMGAVRHGYKVIMNQAAIGTMFDKRRDRYHKKLEKEGVEFI